MCPGRIDAHADDLRAERAELRDTFSELGKLVGSTGAEVEDVGQQDDGAFLKRISQVEPFGPADRQLEIRGRVANRKWGHTTDFYPSGYGPSAMRDRDNERWFAC